MRNQSLILLYILKPFFKSNLMTVFQQIFPCAHISKNTYSSHPNLFFSISNLDNSHNFAMKYKLNHHIQNTGLINSKIVNGNSFGTQIVLFKFPLAPPLPCSHIENIILVTSPLTDKETCEPNRCSSILTV